MSFSAVCRSWMGVCALAAAAAAESAPMAEVGLAYSYNQLETSDSNVSNQSGGSVYGEYFLKPGQRWYARATLGLVGEVSRWAAIAPACTPTCSGPGLTMSGRSRTCYFTESLSSGAPSRVNGATSTGLNGSLARNSFAFGVSDGLGVAIGRHYIVNLFQIEFISAEVAGIATGNSHWRGDSRVSGGLGFSFGQR